MKACCICGLVGEYETRSALIAAQSLYKIRNAQGVRITRYTHTDDTTIWELSICTACMPKARLIYLDDKIRAAATIASIGLLLLAVGVGFVWLGPASAVWAQSRGLVDFLAAIFHGGMNPAAILFTAFCFILGTAMAILGTVILIFSGITRTRMTDRDVVPVEWIGRCFKGEFNRVLDMRKLDVRKGARENQG